MQSEDSSQVVQIKIDNEECSHRIVELIWHHNCTKSAQICEKNCISNQHHDFPKFSHNKISIQDFKQQFSRLEQSCSRQTHHYIRQINDIERIAQENIKKKKQQLFHEIQQVKSTIMKKTYKDLQYRFENLYEKYKGQRFESLKCNEVSWVTKAQPTNHSIKHSVINSKLEAILKKFQNFKEVSRNYAKPMQKQKAKEVKINEKLQEQMIKVIPSIKLPRPDYSIQSSMIDKRRIKELEDKLRDFVQRNRYLTDYITKLVNKQREKTQKLSIVRNVDQIKIQSLIKYGKNISGESRNTSSNGINMNAESKQREGLFSNLFNRNSNMSKKTDIQLRDQLIQNQRIDRRINQSSRQMSQQASKSEKISIEKPRQSIFPEISVNFSLQQSSSKNRNQNEERDISENNVPKRVFPPLSPQYPRQKDQIIPELPQEPSRNAEPQRQSFQQSISHDRSMNHQDQVLSKRQNIENQSPNRVERVQEKQPIVKRQQTQFTYEKWKTNGLIQQMKKHGRNQQSGLKVENIDVLRRFPTLHLEQPRTLQVPRPLMQGHQRSRLHNSNTYNLYALQLFDKEVRKKQAPTPTKQ